MKEVTIEEILNNPKFQLIDVRSPSEYQESHIPGSINAPLFTDQEREEIGTIYKKQGSKEAKWRAMEVVSPRIPQLMTLIRELVNQRKEPAIYCWRGGMRSKAVATFAEFSGLPAVRVIGGYRAYRQHILERLGPQLLPNMVIVLHGLTGVGKTLLLNLLMERGWPVLDLEALANHRGSVFGAFGEWKAHNQKTFDSLFYNRLKELQGQSCIIMEAESKRIGKAILPDFLMEAKSNGIHIKLEAPIPIRVERIYQEYVSPYLGEAWFQDKVQEAYESIKKRMPVPLQKQLEDTLENQEYHTFIQLVLEYYYDPMYSHKLEEYTGEFYTVDLTNLEEGVIHLEQILHSQLDLTPSIV